MEITGVYVKTVFRNETDGFTIFRFKLNKPIIDTPSMEITCKGIIRSSLICVPLKLRGTMENDDYGQTFTIESAEPFSDSESATIEFLSSNLFEGIAEITAKKIVEISGPDIFSFVHEKDAKEQLLSIRGLTEEKVANLMSTILYSKAQKDIFEFVSGFGGNFKHAEILFEKYGAKAVTSVMSNPYEAAELGLPFRICDCIAKNNGFEYDNIERVKAIILNVMQRCYNSGDMYVLIDRIFRGIDYTVKNISVFPDTPLPYGLIVATINNMKQIITEIVQLDDGSTQVRYYLKKAYFDEKTVADNVMRLLKCSKDIDIDPEKAVAEIESTLKIQYSAKQKECFRFLSSSGLKIITGGPGTGKSTVINGLIQSYISYNPDGAVKIMAPTGRAAQRVSEISGLPAGTIHRMLNILPYASDLLDSSYNGDYPADLLIVDEASMLDTSLAALLLKSLKSDTIVIFCGDIDQLPSVGAGNVLHELISSQVIDTVQLDTNFRQTDKSTIIKNAVSVNSGETTLLSDASFEVIECENEEDVQKTVVNLLVDSYNTHHPYDVQVLSSTKKGLAGTFALNKQIQSIINTEKTVGAHASGRFKVNDKVMTIKNNYEMGYFNGDVGVITSSDERSVTVRFLKEEITIPKSLIQDVELAYACTVHKSQGSEHDTVIISLPAEPAVMLKRNLLYTAITRAKKKAIIVTQKNCINRSVVTFTDKKRISALSEKIIKNTGGIKR